MQYINMQGTKVPALGFGTWQLTGENCIKAVTKALQLGYRHIDTAQIYENEGEVGQALLNSGVARKDIFLTTKVWMTNYKRKDVLSSVETSLKKLHTDYVDLLLIHWPNEEVPLRETLQAFGELQKSGKVKHIGVSNFTVELMRQAIEEFEAPIACNQVEYHVLLSQKPVLDFARKHDLMVTAYSPLARGKLENNDTLRDIAAKHGKTVGQIALRWLLDQPNVAAIPKASSESHIKQNLNIFDFKLDLEDTEALNALNGSTRLVNPEWAPEWDQDKKAA